jgi:hypothetical protein
MLFRRDAGEHGLVRWIFALASQQSQQPLALDLGRVFIHKGETIRHEECQS